MRIKRFNPIILFFGISLSIGLTLVLAQAAYFGWPLSNPQYAIQIDLKGCEILAQEENQIDIVSKSLTPEIILRESSHRENKVKIRIYNLSEQHELIGLKRQDKKRNLPRRNGIQGTIYLKPDEERRISAVPKKMEYPFEFAVFGDSEGNDNPLTNKHGSYFVWNRLTDEIKKRNLLFSIEVGDLLSSGEKHHWKRFRKRINLISSSFFPVLGNEDVHPPEGRHHFRTLFGQENYAFSYLDCRFIFLDNSKKEISQDQWRWIQSELETYKKKRIFISMHIPPFYPNNPHQYMEGWDAQSSNRFTTLIKESHVEAVFGAHLHSFYHGVYEGIDYFISGGAGGKLDSLDPGYHFVKIRIEKDKPLSYEVVKLTNKPKVVGWAFRLLGIDY